jgi:C4-dicarboxylate transporter
MVFAVLTTPVSVVYRLLPWLDVVCLVILVVAALAHWQRTRHWCLLALATGSVLMAVGAIASQLVQMQLRPVEKLASGAVRFDTSLLTTLMWVVASGVVVAAVGGIGAIHLAIKLKREPTKPRN